MEMFANLNDILFWLFQKKKKIKKIKNKNKK